MASAGHSVLITGPTGAGKSWLACALAQYACRRGYSAMYQRVPRLQEELRIRHGSGAFGKWLLQLNSEADLTIFSGVA
ncbi:MAG: ATP-binding protein [Pseudomonadota bacterium]